MTVTGTTAPRRAHARLMARSVGKTWAAALTILLLAGCDRTSRDWEAVSQAPTLEGLRRFRQQHPNSEYDASAGEKIVELLWEEARRSRNLEEVRGFRAQYADSPYAAAASAMIVELLWERVKDTDSQEEIEGFLAENPDSQFDAIAHQTHERILWTKALKEGSIATYRGILALYPLGPRTPPMKVLKVQCCKDWSPVDPRLAAEIGDIGNVTLTHESDYERAGLTQRPGPGGVGWVTDDSKGPGTVKGTLTSRLGTKSFSARFGKAVSIPAGWSGPADTGLCLIEGQVVLRSYDLSYGKGEGTDARAKFEARALAPNMILASLDPKKNHLLCVSAEDGRFIFPDESRIETPEAAFVYVRGALIYDPATSTD